MRVELVEGDGSCSGEEFVVILASSNRAAALALAERLRAGRNRVVVHEPRRQENRSADA